MKSVALVIGHGPTRDLGAVNPATGMTEYEWNSVLVPKIANLLIGKVRAHTVRRLVENVAPVTTCNALGVDAAIEFHLNWGENGKASGTEMIHYPSSKRGKALAECLQEAAVRVLKLPNRGAKVPFKGRGNHFLSKTTMPAVIAESFFINNDLDLDIGTAKRDELAKAYADAIFQFLQ